MGYLAFLISHTCIAILYENSMYNEKYRWNIYKVPTRVWNEILCSFREFQFCRLSDVVLYFFHICIVCNRLALEYCKRKIIIIAFPDTFVACVLNKAFWSKVTSVICIELRYIVFLLYVKCFHLHLQCLLTNRIYVLF